MPSRKKETIEAIKNRVERWCAQCKVVQPLSCFHKDKNNPDGLYPYCKTCRKQKSRAYYEENVEILLSKSKIYRKTDRGRAARRKEYENEKKKSEYKVHYTLTNAVRDGRIEKLDYCTMCSITGVKIHGHHYDYTRPLDVVWVCSKCHSWIHKHESHLIKRV